MKTQKFDSLVVGKEMKVNKEGQPYGIVVIMDGTNVLNIVVKDKALYDSAKLYKPCKIVLDVVWGKYPKLEILELEHV